jgi:single-strand DNA-binding protein
MIRDATTVTIVGRAGTNPQVSLGSTGDRVNFRVVSTDRRFDKVNGNWVDGDECWLTVVCWQGLAKAVMSTVRKGDPIVVIGRITNRRYEKNGVTQYFTDVRAELVGLDTARLGSRFSRTVTDAGPSEAMTVNETATPGRAEEPDDSSASSGSAASPWQNVHDDEPAPWDAAEEPAVESGAVLTPSG